MGCNSSASVIHHDSSAPTNDAKISYSPRILDSTTPFTSLKRFAPTRISLTETDTSTNPSECIMFLQRILETNKLTVDANTDVTKFPKYFHRHTQLCGKLPPKLVKKSIPIVVDNDTEFKVNDYRILGLLGEGSYGKVMLALDENSDDLVAIKVLPKSIVNQSRRRLSIAGASGSIMDRISKDMSLLERIRHPNCVSLLEKIDSVDSDHIYLVNEYCAKGQVMEYDDYQGKYICAWYNESPSGGIKESIVRQIMRDTVSGLEYLHRRGIVHRDIKPENLLMDAKGKTKISDFDTGYVFFENEPPILSDTMGTYAFMSPQVLAGEKFNAYATDIWALGVTFYCLLYGIPPWYDTSHIRLFDLIEEAELKIPEKSIISLEGILCLKKMLDKNEDTRITIRGLLDDPWLGADDESMPLLDLSKGRRVVTNV